MYAEKALDSWMSQETTLKPVHIIPLLATMVGSYCRSYSSPFNSDRDLRVIYVSPVEDYLSVFKNERVVKSWKSGDGEWDVSGWDLSRFLQLVWSGDPNAYEVIDSPCTNRSVLKFHSSLQALSREVFNREGLFHGHRGQANNMANAYRHRGMNEFLKLGVSPAKYVLHRAYSLMAAMYVVQTGNVPPLNIQQLSQTMPELCNFDCVPVQELANNRLAGRPMSQRSVHGVFLLTDRLDELVTHSVPFIKAHALSEEQKTRNAEKLNAFLRDVLLNRRKYGAEKSTHA